jgi:hypothetical protein
MDNPLKAFLYSFFTYWKEIIYITSGVIFGLWSIVFIAELVFAFLGFHRDRLLKKYFDWVQRKDR